MKTKILVDFQICISVPLKPGVILSQRSNFGQKIKEITKFNKFKKSTFRNSLF